MIRKDAVEEFVAYVSQRCIGPDATIAPSVFETNSFLIKKQEEDTADKKGVLRFNSNFQFFEKYRSGINAIIVA